MNYLAAIKMVKTTDKSDYENRCRCGYVQYKRNLKLTWK